MAKYRKKPVIIDAFQFGIDPMPDWFMDKVSSNEVILHDCYVGSMELSSCTIRTLVGIRMGKYSDFIIKEEMNGIYPCSAKIMALTYELVEE